MMKILFDWGFGFLLLIYLGLSILRLYSKYMNDCNTYVIQITQADSYLIQMAEVIKIPDDEREQIIHLNAVSI